MGDESSILSRKERRKEYARRAKARIKARRLGLEEPHYLIRPPARTPEQKAERDERRRKSVNERSKVYCERHPDRRKEISRRYYERLRQKKGVRVRRVFKNDQERQQARKDTVRRYQEKSREKRRLRDVQKRLADPEGLRAKRRDWEKRNADKLQQRRMTDAYRSRRRRYHSKRYSEDVNYKLAISIRNSVTRCVKRFIKALGQRPGRTEELIGCSIPEVIEHLRSQFKLGMTLENHGEWHIDHRIPLASVDLTDLSSLKAVAHYTNLQPLWGPENLAKGSKVMGVVQTGN